MKRKFTKIVLLMFSVLCVQWAFAQTAIMGKITDANTGEPLVGATVNVVGTQQSASTNDAGIYSISAPPTAILSVRYMGYQSKEIAINNNTNLNIQLDPEDSILDQIVVVGYGTQTRRNITGAVTTVNMNDTRDVPNTNVSQAIRGRVAGVQILDNGRPGQEGSILIRGPRSLSGSNLPLVVVDGIIFGGSISDINPNDIQTMEVLKDASASAIYGSKAANGVILITSKKGTTSKPTVQFNLFNGVTEYASKVNLFNPERYLQSKYDWREQSGLEVDPAKKASYLTKTEAENYEKGIVHDPWDQASQQGRIGSYDVSIGARTENTNYYLSAAIVNEKGLIYNDNSDRTSFRANIDSRITDWLNIGVNSSFVRRDLSGISANLFEVYGSSPYGTWYHEDGQPKKYIVEEDQVSSNAIYAAKMSENEEIKDNLFSNFYAEIDVPFIEGLSYRANFSPNVRWAHNYTFYKQDRYLNNNTTSASKINSNAYDWTFENIVTYKRNIGDDHAIDITALYGSNHQYFEESRATANQLSIDAVGYNDLSLGNIQQTGSTAYDLNSLSSMLRLNYRLKDKYLFTVTARRDGSSVFAANNKYATFPSGAFAWIVSEEPFMKSSSVFDLLKLRLSYGAVGNQGIDPYQSLSLSKLSKYVFGNAGTTAIGVLPSNMGNDDLKWETTYTFNTAVDFELLSGRLGGTIELYNSRTTDLLVDRTIPIMTGYKRILTNIGEINNKGIEITLNSRNIRNENFEWSSNLAFSHNKNKIVKLYGTDLDGDGREDDDISNNWFIGHPINSYYDYRFDGIYQEGDDMPTGSKPGFVRLQDLNGDGLINAEDRTVVGSGGQPKLRIGLTNNFSYKNFSLSVFVNAMTGWTSNFPLLNTAVSPNAPGRGLNQLDAGYWTKENKSDTRPSLVYNNPLKHGWYVSRDFVRIQDVSLSYNFNSEWMQRIHLSDLRVFVSGKNLYTFTDWPGSDPESGETDAGLLYPMPRIFTLGMNVRF